MTTGRINRVLICLHQAALVHDAAGITDAQLVELFLARRDEAAFAALVHRHGPMVLGVCRRLLNDPHDAEDAFQATFLVLVRRASSIRPRAHVGPWLHGVARRTALKARSSAARRSRAEHEAAQRRPQAILPGGPEGELRPLLDEELSCLPENYRAALVLCLLEGRSRNEAAGLLGWREGTLSGRLARAKQLLGNRLLRRGVALSSAALVADTAAAKVPGSLNLATVQAAAVLCGPATGPLVSGSTIALMEEVLKTMLTSKLKVAAGAVMLLAAIGVGAGVFSAQLGPAIQGAARAETVAEEKHEPKAPMKSKEVRRPGYLIEPPDVLRVEYGPPDSADPVKIAGEHLVRPDGTLGLGSLGSVRVSGLTTEAARDAIAKHLASRLDGFNADRLSVEVVALNSKAFYVIVEGADGTDQVYRFPAKGGETVLDALAQAASTLVGLGKKRVYVERLSTDGKPSKVLPVDWKAITQEGQTATNYPLRPGDRLYIKNARPREAASSKREEVYLSTRTFKVPFEADAASQGIDRLVLFLSDDEGHTYQEAAVARPGEKSFRVTVPSDGVYWFVVQIWHNGRATPADVALATPTLKMVVDTQAPAVTIQRAERGDGTLELRWQVRDVNLDADSLRLEYRVLGEESWSALPIPKRASGRQAIALPDGFPAGPVELRLRATDLASNVGMVCLTLR
jgi:RNA polymerase sigma factor (sigma-70 family)